MMKTYITVIIILTFIIFSAFAQNYQWQQESIKRYLKEEPTEVWQQEIIKKYLKEKPSKILLPEKAKPIEVLPEELIEKEKTFEERYLTSERLELIKAELMEKNWEITLETIKNLIKKPEFRDFKEEEVIKLIIKAKEVLIPELEKLGFEIPLKRYFPPKYTQLQILQVELSKTEGQVTIDLIKSLLANPAFQGLSEEEVINIALKGKVLIVEKPKEILFNRYLKREGPQSPFEVSIDLKPFGYEIFKKIPPPSLYTFPIPSDYIVGPGDEVQVLLWGRINAQYTLTINNDGTILFPQIGPLTVAGMRYEEMRDFLIRQARRIIGTDAAITMGRLRSIQVFVLGEVKNPGVYTLSPMSTIMDALIIAGGPNNIGSLRKIKLKRNNKVICTLDVYDLLLKGDRSNDKHLRHGDVVFVPPVGPLVGVAGNVKRPAIYELKEKTNLATVLKLAGGILPTAYLQHIQVERLENNQKRIILDINAQDNKKLSSFYLQDGDLVKVFSIVKEDTNAIYLYGHVRYPGKYVYKPGMRIKDIIKSTKELLPDTFMDFALVKRLVPPDNHWEYRSFSLRGLLIENSKKDNIELKPYDTIIIYNKWEVMPKKVVTIGGAVNKPGQYEYLSNMKVSDLVKLAGGFKRYAYLEKAELTRIIPTKEGMKTKFIEINLKEALTGNPKYDIPLQEDDYLFIKTVPEWELITVKISGEIMFPGTYVVKKGERLSSLIKRAGGFTDKAYLRGAEFIRKRVQELQQRQLDEMLDRLERELITTSVAEIGSVLGPEEAKIKQAELEMKRRFIAKLRAAKAKGRLVINLAPLEKLKGTIYDIELEDGDKIYIPKNPGTIQVLGAVYTPTAFIYEKGKSLSYYIKKAGGYRRNADKKKVYILKVDGSAIRPGGFLKFGILWNPYKHRWEMGSSVLLEPGDTIVVPEKLERIAWMRNIKDITTILYHVAVTTGVVIAAF
ncbi:MAG TPA: polysaccharide biosynthesis protein [Candidatus Desulfofervidus auxilii]|uniref:Polysaccharide biosynthesis protein n=1 Tax=Desulfofervidus auxilii TaxID=1621989 RepID=A0A7C0U254_DESA2|nr:polysaccharide biosynthesis protein [Candidatus Desulfofervidus auxilii]